MITQNQYQIVGQAIEKLLNENAQSFAADPNHPQNPIPPVVHQALRDHLYKGELPIEEFVLRTLPHWAGANPIHPQELEQALIPAIGRWADHVKGQMSASYGYGHAPAMTARRGVGSPFSGFTPNANAGPSPFGNDAAVRTVETTPFRRASEEAAPAREDKPMRIPELTNVMTDGFSKTEIPPFCTYEAVACLGDLDDAPYSYSYGVVTYSRPVTDIADLLSTLVPQLETDPPTGTWTMDITYRRLLHFPVSLKGYRKLVDEVGSDGAMREAERVIRENTFLHRAYVPLVNARLATQLRIARDLGFIVSVETLEDLTDMIQRPEAILPKSEDPQAWSRVAAGIHHDVVHHLLQDAVLLDSVQHLRDILRCPRIYTHETKKLLAMPVWEMTDDQRAKLLKDILARNTILTVPERAVLTNHPDIHLQAGPADLRAFGVSAVSGRIELEACFHVADIEPVTRICHVTPGKPESFQAMTLLKTVTDPRICLLEPCHPRWFFLDTA